MKMKSLFMSAIILTTMAGSSVTAFAATEDGYKDATHVQTETKLTFEKDEDPVKPVDPTDPDNPIDPVDPTNPEGAELMITYASNLNFGEQAKQRKSWNALADKVKDGEGTRDITPFVSIKDSRGTDRKSWSLTVKQDGAFVDSEDNKLAGAELVFSNLKFAELAGAPTAKEGEVTLSETPQEIASADENSGVGVWSLPLGTLQEDSTTNGVTLKVPQQTAKNTDTYSTTVTYELTADATK